MFRIIFTIILVISVFTLIGIFIPDSVTADIDSALTYFFTYVYALDGLFNVSTFFTCFLILTTFYTGIALYLVIHWILKHTTAGR